MFPTWLCADSDESSADSEVSSASSLVVKRVVDVEKTGGGGEMDKNGAQEGVSADLIIVIFFSTNIICDICDKYELCVHLVQAPKDRCVLKLLYLWQL